jgi:hypothetical protein
VTTEFIPIDLAGAERLHDDSGVPNGGVTGTAQVDIGAFEFQGTSNCP